MLKKLLEDWPKEYVRPVLVSLATAAALTLLSWTFEPVRNFFAPPERIKNYPLFCTAEPYIQSIEGNLRLVVEFFIVNKTSHPWTRQQLSELVRQTGADGSKNSSATIFLEYSRGPLGKLEKAFFDPDFNDDKGVFEVRHEPGGNNLEIIVDSIEPRAIAKATIVVSDLPNLADDKRVRRTTKAAVPFKFVPLQDACYSPNR